MATTPSPSIAQGQSEVQIDTFNQWMRAQPFYQTLLKSWGQDPGHPHDLSDSQKTQIVRAAQAVGAKVDESNMEVDDNGNFRNQGHKLRNTLIVAGIAGAALATAGLAGAFAGGGVGAGAGGGGSALASTAVGSGMVPAIAGGTGLATAAGGGATLAASSAIPWGTIVGAGSQLFGNLFGAHETSSAADRAAEIAAAGSKYSADLTAKAAADALKFQYANAENAYQNNEASRQGNYGLFAARERRLGPIGEEVGMAPREIPAYVPGVDPGFGTMGDAATGSSGAPPSTGSPSGGNPADPNAIMAALTDNYKKLGVAPTGPGSGPTDIAYMAKQIAATGGLAPGNASYWLGPQGRIAQELAKTRGGGSAPTGAPSTAASYAPATTATPFMPPPPSAAIPQSLGYYA